jgi:hypothetical protein
MALTEQLCQILSNAILVIYWFTYDWYSKDLKTQHNCGH